MLPPVSLLAASLFPLASAVKPRFIFALMLWTISPSICGFRVIFMLFPSFFFSLHTGVSFPLLFWTLCHVYTGCWNLLLCKKKNEIFLTSLRNILQQAAVESECHRYFCPLQLWSFSLLAAGKSMEARKKNKRIHCVKQSCLFFVVSFSWILVQKWWSNLKHQIK